MRLQTLCRRPELQHAVAALGEADGIVAGIPVYAAGAVGSAGGTELTIDSTLTSCASDRRVGYLTVGMPAMAAEVSSRRSGTTRSAARTSSRGGG